MLRDLGQCGRKCNNKAIVAAAAAAIACVFGNRAVRASDVSAPVVLQAFESNYSTLEYRMPDIVAAGYGSVYLPPVGRADSDPINKSVGYDQYDRFDLGYAGNPTTYGTEAGLKALVNALHTGGKSAYVDLVWNHSGFRDSGTDSGNFAKAGGYPGFALTLQTSNPAAAGYNQQGINAVDGDYHSVYASGDQDERLAGLVDIDQSTNNQFIRNPTTVGDPRNIPGPAITGYNTDGTPIYYSENGRTANVPTASNAQYYPTISDATKEGTFYDPSAGDNFTVYKFAADGAATGTPTVENALGYLMRNTQWLVQDIGVDGFRIDAAKNMPTWVLNYYDRAVFKSSNRYLLDGEQEAIYGFSEVFDSSTSLLSSYTRKDLNMNSNTVGGNRDVLDFPLYFAMKANLTGTDREDGGGNNWYNIVDSSFNYAMGHGHDGTYGVEFVSNQDNYAPDLDNVAYAYMLLQPGNAVVYYNAHEFGDNRDFPKPGRGDAIGAYDSTITNLVDIRNRYGRGNYIERYIDQDNYAYERDNSCVVLLSDRTHAGYDSRTIQTDFAPGTPLIELTGNATSKTVDPNGDIPGLVVVNADGTINIRFLHNSSYNGSTSFYTGDGYLIYGLATPQGNLSVSNVASVMASAQESGGASSTTNEINATTRLANVDVVRGGTFTISLTTNQVNLLGFYRDKPADGDNAVFKIDGGISVKGNALDTTPGSVTYGYEEFGDQFSPGYLNSSGNGIYTQVVTTSNLSDGYHYITVMAFRHRDDGGPAVYSDWTQTIYVDLHKPTAAFGTDTPIVYNDTGVTHYDQHNYTVQSTDELANNMHLFFDLPAGYSQSQILSMVNDSNNATQTDRNLWQIYEGNVTKGNHVITAVVYKPDGNYAIYRYTGLGNANSPIGAAMGDAVYSTGSTANNYAAGPDGYIAANDVKALYDAIKSNNQIFYAADDFNGDGLMNYADWAAMGQELTALNQSGALNAGGSQLVTQDTIDYYNLLGPSVPEPASLSIIGLGSVALLSRRRRRPV